MWRLAAPTLSRPSIQGEWQLAGASSCGPRVEKHRGCPLPVVVADQGEDYGLQEPAYAPVRLPAPVDRELDLLGFSILYYLLGG